MSTQLVTIDKSGSGVIRCHACGHEFVRGVRKVGSEYHIGGVAAGLGSACPNCHTKFTLVATPIGHVSLFDYPRGMVINFRHAGSVLFGTVICAFDKVLLVDVMGETQ